MSSASKQPRRRPASVSGHPTPSAAPVTSGRFRQAATKAAAGLAPTPPTPPAPPKRRRQPVAVNPDHRFLFGNLTASITYHDREANRHQFESRQLRVALSDHMLRLYQLDTARERHWVLNTDHPQDMRFEWEDPAEAELPEPPVAAADDREAALAPIAAE